MSSPREEVVYGFNFTTTLDLFPLLDMASLFHKNECLDMSLSKSVMKGEKPY